MAPVGIDLINDTWAGYDPELVDTAAELGAGLVVSHTGGLPPRTDPGYDAAAAWALLEGANSGDSYSAELATGYRWGEPTLRPHVERILADARASGNERLEQLAERFLR